VKNIGTASNAETITQQKVSFRIGLGIGDRVSE
jgi:hypothetical protein